MGTTVFLIRHGVTDWHEEGKLLGQRDLSQNARGRGQAEACAALLAGQKLADIVSSPLQRALETAEIIAKGRDLQVARDPRLTARRAGEWTGLPLSELEARAEYPGSLTDPCLPLGPGGETLEEVERRAVAAVEQALGDSLPGDSLAIVSHEGPIRALLGHYLGCDAPLELAISPGSVSAVSFADRSRPRILAINCSTSLSDILA